MRIMSTSKTVPLAVSYLHFNCFLKLVVELTNLSSLGKEFHNLQDLIKKTLLKMFCTGSWYNEVVMANVEEQENYFSLSLLLCVGPVGSGRR